MLKPNEIPHCEIVVDSLTLYLSGVICRIREKKILNFEFIFAAGTWPFLVTLLIRCVSLEIASSKKRLPKLVFAKTLRIVVQRAEGSKLSGQLL